MRRFWGFDVLQELLEDKRITEIMVNGPDRSFIEKDGRLTQWQGRFESPARLLDVIQQIAAGCNRVVNEASPILDARLSDGSRVNVVLSPVALNGPAMTIRRFPEEGMTLEDVQAAIRLEAGSGDLEPTVSVRETADGFSLSGTCYEKDGEKGFEPGSTVSVIVSDGVHFAGYSEDVETMVLYVYKEEVEVVDFSDEIAYELWDQVTSYTPVVSYEDKDQSENLDEEVDQRDYDPGEIVLQTDKEYKKRGYRSLL